MFGCNQVLLASSVRGEHCLFSNQQPATTANAALVKGEPLKQLKPTESIHMFVQKLDHQLSVGSATMSAVNEDRHTGRVAEFITLPAARH